MTRITQALVVLTCLAASSAVASTRMTVAAKIWDHSNSQLCFLETSTTDEIALLVRDELARRNVTCTPALVSRGEASLAKARQIAQARDEAFARYRNVQAGAAAARAETDRLIMCASLGGQAGPGCRNGY